MTKVYLPDDPGQTVHITCASGGAQTYPANGSAIDIRPEFVESALANRCSLEGPLPAPTPEPVETVDPELVAAVQSLLAEGNPKDFTATNDIRTAAVARVYGHRPSMAQIAEAVAQAKAAEASDLND